MQGITDGYIAIIGMEAKRKHSVIMKVRKQPSCVAQALKEIVLYSTTKFTIIFGVIVEE